MSNAEDMSALYQRCLAIVRGETDSHAEDEPEEDAETRRLLLYLTPSERKAWRTVRARRSVPAAEAMMQACREMLMTLAYTRYLSAEHDAPSYDVHG